MLPQEALAWERAAGSKPRRDYTLREQVSHDWIPLGGKRHPVPDPADGVKLPEQELWHAPGLEVQVWPVPENPKGTGPRREVMVTLIDCQ
jgi:hypothetical protein